MKYSLVLLTLLSVATFAASSKVVPQENEMEVISVPAHTSSTINVSCPTKECKEAEEVQEPNFEKDFSQKEVLEREKSILISVIGQGVAPMNTNSPAQAYALAKRAATADAYRLIAEKVKGVYVEGQDLVQNMMIKRSTVRTSVTAMVRNANVIETTFKEGLCEVEMEIKLSHSQFPQ